MRKLAWLQLSIILLTTLGAAPPKRSPQAAKVSITTRLDKTALWIGDPLNYTIQVIHDRDVEFILDDLKKESLPLAPFVVRAISIQQGEWAQNKKLLEITLLLSSYESGRTDLTIPPFNLYYFKRLPGIEKKETVAEAIRVPANRVGLRSTLSGSQNIPREFKPISTMDLRRGLIALLLGSAGMIFIALRSVRWAWMVFHRGRPTKRRVRQRDREKFARESLARIQAIGGKGPEDLIRFYAEVSQFLRQYLNQWLEIEADSLTPEEIEVALEKANINGSLAQQIKTILEQCDMVRYGKEGLRLGGDLRDRVFKAMEGIVGAHQN